MIDRTERARITYESDWERVNPGGVRPPLSGEFGRLLLREIEARWNSGPSEIEADDGGDPLHVYGQRWQLIGSCVDVGFHAMHRAADQRGLLYRKPMAIDGELARSSIWQWLRNRAKLDSLQQEAQRITIGIGACCVLPTLSLYHQGQYYPPGLEVLYPGQIELEERAGQIVRAQRGAMVWDLIDPTMPRWGEQSGTSWRWVLEGLEYPWWYAGEPIMPVVPIRDHWAREPLHVDFDRVQGTLDIIMRRTWIEVVRYLGSFSRVFTLSEQELSGLEQTMLSPGVINQLFGPGASGAKFETIEDDTAAATRLEEMAANRIDEVLSQFDPGLKVRRSEAAKSGVAIKLELTGLYTLRQKLATQATPWDTQIVQALVATWNYLVRSGQISIRQRADGQISWTPSLSPDPTALLPESTFGLHYPFQWTSDERDQLRAEMLEAIQLGLESPRAIWLLDRELDDDRPSGPNWQRAMMELEGNLRDADHLSALGFGLDWSQRSQRVQETPDPEEETYTPPATVADTAAHGLQLREDFPGRSLSGSPPTPQNTRLLQRARRLRDEAAFVRGELRQLRTWLEGHQVPTEDESDPSGEWITYQTQGGDEALVWIEEVLGGASN